MTTTWISTPIPSPELRELPRGFNTETLVERGHIKGFRANRVTEEVAEGMLKNPLLHACRSTPEEIAEELEREERERAKAAQRAAGAL